MKAEYNKNTKIILDLEIVRKDEKKIMQKGYRKEKAHLFKVPSSHPYSLSAGEVRK